MKTVKLCDINIEDVKDTMREDVKKVQDKFRELNFELEGDFSIVDGKLFSLAENRARTCVNPYFAEFSATMQFTSEFSDEDWLQIFEELSKGKQTDALFLSQYGSYTKIPDSIERASDALSTKGCNILDWYVECSGNRRRNIKRILKRVDNEGLHVRPLEVTIELIEKSIPVCLNRFGDTYSLEGTILATSPNKGTSSEVLGLYNTCGDLISYATFVSNTPSLWAYNTFFEMRDTGNGTGKEMMLLGALYLTEKYGDITLDSTNAYTLILDDDEVTGNIFTFNMYKSVICNSSIPYYIKTIQYHNHNLIKGALPMTHVNEFYSEKYESISRLCGTPSYGAALNFYLAAFKIFKQKHPEQTDIRVLEIMSGSGYHKDTVKFAASMLNLNATVITQDAIQGADICCDVFELYPEETLFDLALCYNLGLTMCLGGQADFDLLMSVLTKVTKVIIADVQTVDIIDYAIESFTEKVQKYYVTPETHPYLYEGLSLPKEALVVTVNAYCTRSITSPLYELDLTVDIQNTTGTSVFSHSFEKAIRYYLPHYENLPDFVQTNLEMYSQLSGQDFAVPLDKNPNSDTDMSLVYIPLTI